MLTYIGVTVLVIIAFCAGTSFGNSLKKARLIKTINLKKTYPELEEENVNLHIYRLEDGSLEYQVNAWINSCDDSCDMGI